MSMTCEFILQWSATPEQLTTLGTAMWRWCLRTAGNTGIYQYHDNQALADLIAGQLPASGPGERRGVHLRLRDEVSPDRQTTIARLRREIPTNGVADIIVDGASWNQIA